MRLFHDNCIVTIDFFIKPVSASIQWVLDTLMNWSYSKIHVQKLYNKVIIEKWKCFFKLDVPSTTINSLWYHTTNCSRHVEILQAYYGRLENIKWLRVEKGNEKEHFSSNLRNFIPDKSEYVMEWFLKWFSLICTHEKQDSDRVYSSDLGQSRWQ